MSAHERNWFTETPLRRFVGAVVVVCAAALLLSAIGCNMSVREDETRGSKKVDIETPFGDLKVQNQADAKQTGLPVYPGATPKPSRHDDDDKGQASVSMSMFGLKVAVISYVSDDSPDKVLAWYRGEMKPMGSFIECTGSGDVGNAHIEGDSDKGGLDDPVTCDKDSGDRGRKVTQLRLGTKGNQKIVAIAERKDGKPGSEFALIRVIVGKGKGDTI